MQTITQVIIFFTLSVRPVQILEFSTDQRSSIGSLMGGYEMRFRILGLDADYANNQIYLEKKQCQILDDGSSDSQNNLGQIIRCKTPQTDINQTILPFLQQYPNTKGTYSLGSQIIIKVKGKTDTQHNIISQSIDATPILYQVIGSSIYPEQVILFQYSIWAYDSKYNKFFIGQHLCQSYQSLPLNNLINYYCKLPQDIEAGYYNVTIKAPSGLQYNRPESFQQNFLTQQQYQVLVVPSITKLSTNLASNNGQVLIIYGNGFTQFREKIQLSITGQNILYDILDTNETKIRVMISNYSVDTKQSQYLQSSGLQYTRYNLGDSNQIYNSSYLLQQIQGNKTELDKLIIKDNIISQPEQFQISDPKYGEYYRGYFKAPYNGNYTFQLSSNDNVELSFSQKEGFSNNELKVIAFTNSSKINFRSYQQSLNSNSQPLILVQGNYYYIELYHYSNNINSNLTLSVQIQNDKSTILYQPIPNQLLYVFSDKPQINLYIQGLLSICELCQYQLTQLNNFTLQSFTKNNQTLKLTIRSEQTSTQLLLNQITIKYGGVKCYALNLTKTNNLFIVNCLLETQDGKFICEAGDNIPIVDIYPIGVINVDSTVQPITQNIIITSVDPSVGSRDGGTFLTIKGDGFPIVNQNNDFQIKIGGSIVFPTTSNNHEINVVTNPYQGSSTIEIYFNNKTYSSDKFFQYVPIYKGFLTIYARNLGNDKTVLNVTFENQDKTYVAPIVSIQNEQLKVYLRGGMPGNYSINIYKNGYERSISETNQSNIFQYGVFIKEVQPSQGSLFGGTTLRIIGLNFVIEESLVFIGKGVNQICEINQKVSNETYIECVTSQKPEIPSYDNPVDVAVVTRASLESVCINQQGCKFQYTDGSTPKLQNFPQGVKQLGTRLLIQDEFADDEIENLNIGLKEQLKQNHQQKHHRLLQQSKSYLRSRQLSQITSYKVYYSGDNETLNFIGELNKSPKIILKGSLYNFQIDAQISQNNIQYQMPNIPQGDYQTFIQFDQGYVDKQWISSIPLDIFDIDQDELSCGGQLITLTGSGFNLDKGLKIKIQDLDCLNIKLISNSQLQCRTPLLNTGLTDLILQQNNQQTNILLNAFVRLNIRTKSIKLTNINLTNLLIQQQDRVNYIGDASQIDLVIFGQKLIEPNYLNKPQVYLKSESLQTTYNGTIQGEVTANQISVQFKQIPYGRYLLDYQNDKVYSNNTLKIYVQGNTDLKTDLINQSIAGGQNITIKGQGFDQNKSNNKVLVCGLSCDILEVSWDKIICESPPLLSQSIIKQFPQQFKSFHIIDKNDMILSSSDGYLNSYLNNILFDNQQSSCIYLGVGKQSLIVEFQSFVLLELKNISFTISNDANVANNFIGTKLQYQLNGQDTWKDFYVIESAIKLGENSFQLQNSVQNIKKLRIYDEQSKSRCNICELKIKGRLTQNILNNYDQDTKCGAQVIVNDFQFPIIENVAQYQIIQTPFVENISAKYVPTDYGVNITIIGTAFGNSNSQIRVLIDNVNCVIQGHNETQINCTTGIKDLITNQISGEFKVQVNGNLAINKQIVQYGNLWSDINTWGGYVFPSDGDSVIVKQGQILIVDMITPKLISILIEGTLLFADNGKLNTLDAQYLIIHYGSLIIGSSDQPYQSRAETTLRGEYNDTQLIGFGNKVLGCYQCNLQIFGKPKTPVWTLLNKTIEIGDNQVLLDERVNWNIGDQIVVTSSDFDQKQSETKRIIDIQQDNHLIIVDSPFQYQHYSKIEQYDDQYFHNKVEVGVLRRNIRILGDQSKYQNNYGYNLKIYGDISQNTQIQIQYTEFINGGQTYYQGRHPIYFKQNNDLTGSFLVGNSIYNNNARCIVLNQVQNIIIQNNICFNTQGHSIYFLSGLETNNKLYNNLIINTKTSNQLSQSDVSPSGMLITNPQNVIKGNRVAGSDYNGFLLDFTQNPDYVGNQDCRAGLNLTEFSDNSAHSNFYGLNIPKILPQVLPCQQFITQDPCYYDLRNGQGFVSMYGWYGGWGQYYINICPDPKYAQSIKSYLTNFRTWLNSQNGIQIYNIGNVELIDSQIADSINSSIYVQQTDQSNEGFLINRSLIIKNSQNNKNLNQSIGFIMPRTQIYSIENITICNYKINDTIFVIDKQINLFTRNTSTNYIINGVKFINSFANIIDESFKKAIFWDLAGSLTKSKPMYIIEYKNYLEGIDGCEKQNQSYWDNTMFCFMEKVEIRNVKFIEKDGPFAIQRSQGDQLNNFTNTIDFESDDLILATGITYDIYFPNNKDSTKGEINFMIQNSNYYKSTAKGIIFRFDTVKQIFYSLTGIGITAYSFYGSYTQAKIDHSLITYQDQSLAAESCLLGYNHYERNQNLYQLCVKQKESTYKDQFLRVRILLDMSLPLIIPSSNPTPQPTLPTPTPPAPTPTPIPNPTPEPIPTPSPVPPPPPPIPTNYKFVWSNPDAWESKQIPIQDEIVTIRSGCTIILDIDPPLLQNLVILGTLIFDDERTISILKTHSLWIRGSGSLLAGSSTKPYKGKINIQIVSNQPDNMDQQLVMEGILQLYGAPPFTKQTRLVEFASKGNNTIKVDSSQDWQIGDLIAIGPSGSDPNQSEEFTIKFIQDNVITLSGKLEFNHFGESSVTLENSQIGKLDMRAAVGHLTRNIQIGTGQQNIPLRISKLSDYQNTGQLILVGVEMSYSVQNSYDQNPLLNLMQSRNGIQIVGCTFHHSNGRFIQAQNTEQIMIKDNVFFQGQGALVQFNNIRKLVFTNNLLISAKQPNALFGNFIYEDNTEITSDNIFVSDNVGQGSQDSGFLFMTSSCQNSQKISFINNQCSSTNYVCFSYRQSDGNCDYIGSAFAYHSQTGILASLYTKQIKVSQLILVENEINLIIKMGTDEIKNNQLQISNSFISTFLRPNCILCYSKDLLPYCQSSIGIQIPTVTTKANPPTISQFARVDQLTTIEAVDARVYIFSLIFDGFKDIYPENTYCGKNSVFKQHPQAADASPQLYLTNTICQNCNQAGLLYNLRTPDPSLLGWLGGCGSFQCTGQINILIEDQDGSFFGQIGQAIGNNFYFAPNVTYCKRVDSWIGYFCQGSQITVLNFMNTASDYNTRLYSPVQLTDGQFFNQVNSFKEWSWIGDQPMNKRESKFVSIVKSNSVINMTNAGENPTESLYWLSRRKQSGSPADYVIIKMQFSQTNILQVSLNNNIIQPGITQSDDHWNLQDKKNECGANNYFSKNRTIHFVVTGDSNCYVKISLKNTIQVTSRIALTQDSFLGKDFLQYAVAQLGGDPYNYFILSVRKISKRRNIQSEAAYYDIEWGIVDPAPIGSQEAQDSKTRLASIQIKITEMKSSTSSPYQVVSSQVNITTIDSLNFESSEKAAPSAQSNDNIFIPNNTQTQQNDYVISLPTQNLTDQNNTNNTLNMNGQGNTNKTELNLSNNTDDNRDRTKIIILCVLVPILFILFILLGIAIYKRLRNTRQYKVAPSIQSDSDFKCKVDRDDQ
ncbi:hypothetical protein pb186bvf_011892 [Paramecium bursaria]